MSEQSTRPRHLDARDFPNWDAYQHARARELTNTRIRNMRATNRQLSIAQIAGQTGVSIQDVKDVLGLPDSFPSY